MSIADRFNAALARTGHSQRHLARRCGISRSTLHRLLAGGDCRLSVWRKLARELQVSEAWLAFGLGVKPLTVGPDTTLFVRYASLDMGDGRLDAWITELQRQYPANRIVYASDDLSTAPNSPAAF